MPIAHEQISVVIDGRSIVEAYTKRRLLHDLVIRHPQVPVFARERCEFNEDQGVTLPRGAELAWSKLAQHASLVLKRRQK